VHVPPTADKSTAATLDLHSQMTAATATLRAEFALAKALLCIRVRADNDIEMGIASYPFPPEITARYCAVFEPMDIAAPIAFDLSGAADKPYDAPPALTPDQACFSGTFRTDFNQQFERARAFVRASWIARGVVAAAFAERASETLYAVSAMIGEAALALATDDALAADALAEEALARVPGDFDAPLPARYRDILDRHFTAAAWRVDAAAGEICVANVLKDLVEGRTDAAVLGALAAARAVAAAARALERRRLADARAA